MSVQITVLAKILRRFSDCLMARHQGVRPKGNLYDANINMIDAFTKLYDETPLIKFGHNFVQQSILEAAQGFKHLHILDIGFGSGGQWIEFLKHSDKQLTLYAIDVEQEHTNVMLDGFRRQLQNLQLVERVELIPILKHVESLDFKSLAKGRFTVVNAALSLHHVQPDSPGKKGRRSVLSNIRAYNPDLFTLVEPDSDHNNENFELVLQQAMQHYYLVFCAVENFVRDKNYVDFIEENFFGKEIENIVCNDDHERYERHQRYEQWRDSLLTLGFSELKHQKLEIEGQSILAGSTWT